MTGQHVGRLSDAVTEDDTRSAARAQARALEALKRPVPRATGPRHDYGDGDRCPVTLDHGRMYHLKGSGRQWCPHSDHAGGVGKGGAPQTRCFWPAGPDSFTAAVTAWKEQQHG